VCLCAINQLTSRCSDSIHEVSPSRKGELPLGNRRSVFIDTSNVDVNALVTQEVETRCANPASRP
jgi:hypothetical protein